ncbi:hypothetical protein OG21DRAFT_1525437 [Imleria badia]|nr:hypothetical protein OG21DRAFT_1525437 [Imleria badia]
MSYQLHNADGEEHAQPQEGAASVEIQVQLSNALTSSTTIPQDIINNCLVAIPAKYWWYFKCYYLAAIHMIIKNLYHSKVRDWKSDCAIGLGAMAIWLLNDGIPLQQNGGTNPLAYWYTTIEEFFISHRASISPVQWEGGLELANTDYTSMIDYDSVVGWSSFSLTMVSYVAIFKFCETALITELAIPHCLYAGLNLNVETHANYTRDMEPVWITLMARATTLQKVSHHIQ